MRTARVTDPPYSHRPSRSTRPKPSILSVQRSRVQRRRASADRGSPRLDGVYAEVVRARLARRRALCEMWRMCPEATSTALRSLATVGLVLMLPALADCGTTATITTKRG